MASGNFSVCIFCGSRDGNRSEYTDAAAQVGQEIARRNWRLVYGAGDIGLMGTVARNAQAAGADTLGVIPGHLLQQEVAKRDLTQLVVTETMHERKKVMYMNSDALVVLPGGAGSLDELFEVLTWRQLGLHGKPIILLNTLGYWDKFLELLDYVVERGFADASITGFVQAVGDVDNLFQALEAAQN